MSKWWKCDLQVATPGEPRFSGPDSDWDTATEAGRIAAADRYMVAAKDAAIEVIVLADHNSTAWADIMVEAGRRHNIIVFPGFEVTTGTGADGAHAIIFSSPDKKAADLDALLYTACGFNDDHPRFNLSRPDEPAPSPNTLPQILDALPEDYLVIAPHIFNDNGLASSKTAKSMVRWKALHHDRLGAVDVGNISPETKILAADGASDTSFKAKFVRRELEDYPCLPRLAFVSTSDTYSLADIGTRYTWIRMTEPTLEGVRQAFLDHESRLICDWDDRYRDGDASPNDVTHAWVAEVTLAGLATTTETIKVTLSPRLTVIVGGRGAGKSTIVAALRNLYGDTESLPMQARTEALQLRDAVFPSATVTSRHHLAHSGETQTASWTASAGSRTDRANGTPATRTDFKVRVISQKELFERAAKTSDDPHSTSRNLLALVDDALATGGAGTGLPGSFESRIDEARTRWVGAARELHSEEQAVSGRPQVRQRVAELQRQVAAFDNEANRARRRHNDQLLAEKNWLDTVSVDTRAVIENIANNSTTRLSAASPPIPVIDPEQPANPALETYSQRLQEARDLLRAAITDATTAALQSLDDIGAFDAAEAWQRAVEAAQLDSDAYLRELAALGLDPAIYEQVRQQLRDTQESLDDLDRRASQLDALRHRAEFGWTSLLALYAGRHERRAQLLQTVQTRSGLIRFTLREATDTSSWVTRVRSLLNLRSDGFLEEVPALARWLWAHGVDHETRQQAWRDACISGDFSEIATQARLRAAWAARLRDLDPLVRTRLAAEIADETVEMEFRREAAGASLVEQWEPLTSGSPGQRSAAMLSFVLHQGSEPLVLDQPEDDLDTEWISQLVVAQLRTSRWKRQVVVITHNANIPVNADAERIVVLENDGSGVRVRRSVEGDNSVEHCGALEDRLVRADIQQIMEGGVDAFIRRERRYNNELSVYRAALRPVR